MLNYELFLPIVMLVTLGVFSWKQRSTDKSDRQFHIAIGWSCLAVFMMVVFVFNVAFESYLNSIFALLAVGVASKVALYFRRMDIDNKVVNSDG